MPVPAPFFSPGPYERFAINPFAGIDVGLSSSPVFVDLDGDGDLDLAVGARDGTLEAFEQTATGFSPFASNPLAGIDVGRYSAPSFTDFDLDGDLDLVVGENGGTLKTFERTDVGYKFISALSPLVGIDVGYLSKPTFTDLDGDGDDDLVVGEDRGALKAFEHTSTGFVAYSINPFAGIDVGFFSAPAFADLDGDGDLDLVVGELYGAFRAYERTEAGFASFAADPFASVDVGSSSAPAFADLDGDGDLDIVAGDRSGALIALENRTSIAFVENDIGVVLQRTATDPAGGPIVYSLGGTDAALFSIDQTTGAVRFVTAPDFEAPGDAGGDNNYDIVVIASNAEASTSLQVSVSVTNGRAPVFAPGPLGNFPSNIFAGIDVGYQSAPAIVDLDGDGDLDLVVGEGFGSIRAYERTEAGLTPFAANPFGAINVGFQSTPTFVDLDGDGKVELVVGAGDGRLRVYEQFFVDTEFVPVEVNPLAGIDVGEESAPAFGDLDGDGDLDLVVGADDGTLHAFERTDSGFVTFENDVRLSPVGGIDVGTDSIPAFTDLDGDGDADLIVGERDGGLKVFEQTGSKFVPFATNAFESTNVDALSSPAFADLDGDGDLDLIVGALDGSLTGRQAQPPIEFAESGNGIVFQRTASDPDGRSISYSLAGPDAALFRIDDTTGNVRFATPPNFEAPVDAGHDNVYDVVVVASDGEDTATLAVTVAVTNVVQGPVFAPARFAAPAVNPLAGIDVGFRSSPALIDLNGDGSVELVAGSDSGALQTYTRGASGFTPLVGDPLDGLGASFQTAPAFADLDGDGDLDLIVGERYGTLSAYERITTGFVAVAANPFAAIDAGSFSTSAFADLDGDGDLDLVVGELYGTLSAYEQTGAGFAAFATNPLAGIDVGRFSTPAFGDLDGDGDLDLVVGNEAGMLSAFEHTATGFTAFATDPFGGLDVGGSSAPAFGDLDNDGDADLVVGLGNGTFATFLNQAASSKVFFAENAAGTVFQRTAVDPDGDPIVYSLGGADAARFSINESTGAVSFRASPDFEAPADADGDNVYDLTVIAADAERASSLLVSVTVTDVTENEDKDVILVPGPPGQVRVTFTSSEVGNGDVADSGIQLNQDGGLAVRLQREDGSGALTGPITRYRDEGITFAASTGVTFDVRDLVSGTPRGDRFEAVAFGTQAADSLVAEQPSRSYYLNAGMGDDAVTGGTAIDFLVGGAGNDRLEGREGNDSFIGGAGRDRFFYSLAGETGTDTILDFQTIDLFVSDARLRDGNNDGIITFGPNSVLDLGADDDTVAFASSSAVNSLRLLGQLPDGNFAYADAATRPTGAREGLLGDSTLNGGNGRQVFFFDTALGLNFGNDRITSFGPEDLLVTTAAIPDSNGDGRIGFGADRTLDLPNGTSVVINNYATRSLELDGSITQNGVTYFLYSSIESTQTGESVLFG